MRAASLRHMTRTRALGHVADLARLGLTDEEIKRAGEQLGAILEAVETIRELDLEGVPPTTNPLNLTNVFRADEPRKELTQEEALSEAPATLDGYFVVPRID